MSRFLKFLLYVWLLFVCYSCVKYNRMTHLNDEELEWITNRSVGEKMYFQSQSGVIDTITIREIIIQNTTDSIDWNYYTTGGDGVYHAGGEVYFSLRDIPYFNSFYLYKDTDELVYFGVEILYTWVPHVYIVDTCIQIGGTMFEDIAFFDERSCELINRTNSSNPIKSLAWSKRYGLIQYTFQDGTEFNRIILDTH